MLDTDVEYFMAAATAGGLGRAASALGLTQPALTKSIQRLEKRLGVQLFVRTPRGAALTEAGAAFLRRCQAAAHSMGDAVQEARDIGGGHAGLLQLGASPAAQDFVVRALFPKLRQDRPAAVLQLRTAFGDTLVELLEAGRLSLAVCPLPAGLPPSLHAEPLYDEDFNVVLRHDHPLAQHEALTAEQLLQWDFAASGKQEFARLMIEEGLARKGLPLPRVKVESNSLRALMGIVARTDLVTLLPASARQGEQGGGGLLWRPIRLPGVRRQVGILATRGYLSPMALRAMDLLRTHAATLPQTMLPQAGEAV